MNPSSRSAASKRRVESEDIMKPCQSPLQSKKKKNCGGGDDDFLFAEEMGKEYLIRGGGSSESRVGIEILRGKYVGILFSEQSGSAESRHCYKVLLQVYNEIREKHGAVFELVYVAKASDDDDPYQKRNLTFLAVPFGDLEWRKRLFNTYFIYNPPRDLLLFDPQGRPMKDEPGEFKVCLNILEALTIVFGSAFYPFTAAREMQLIEEGLAAMRSNSLQVILGGDFK